MVSALTPSTTKLREIASFTLDQRQNLALVLKSSFVVFLLLVPDESLVAIHDPLLTNIWSFLKGVRGKLFYTKKFPLQITLPRQETAAASTASTIF